jgi:hypothetical protein
MRDASVQPSFSKQRISRKTAVRLIEELLPFVAYFINRGTLEKRSDRLPEDTISEYRLVPNGELDERLSEEGQRATDLDEKTSKMTLAFTLSLGILGAASGMASHLPASFALAITVGILISAGYILIGGWLALAGFRTLPRFGYGTRFRVEKRNAPDPLQLVVENLLRQEIQNQIRHVRNEATFQCLRNGFLAFGITLIIYIVGLYSSRLQIV